MEGIKMNKVKEERVTDLSIIMDMIAGKTPYYSIRYRNVGEDDYNIGYSSLNLKTVLGFIDEYFEIVENGKQTNADRIRNMSDEELAEFMSENTSYYYCGVRCKDRPKSPTESSCNFRWLEWLQSEAE
jgi:hypothetical protein